LFAAEKSEFKNLRDDEPASEAERRGGISGAGVLGEAQFDVLRLVPGARPTNQPPYVKKETGMPRSRILRSAGVVIWTLPRREICDRVAEPRLDSPSLLTIEMPFTGR